MAEDIFGYNIDVKSKQVVAARNAALTLGGGNMALVQRIEGNYGHEANMVYEAGSTSVYFVHGQPQGTITYGTLVGSNGWFKGIADKSGLCASLQTITTTLKGGGNCDVQVSGKTTCTFEGALLQNVNFQVNAQELYISNGGTFKCAAMHVS